MNIKHTIWAVGILFGICILAGAIYFIFVLKSSPKTFQPTTTLPVSGSTVTSSTTSSGGVQTIVLATRDDSAVVANDFIHNGVTIPDVKNEGNYLLAGNLGYCLSDPQKCQAAPSSNFSVYYVSSRKSFLINLTEEPLGQARLDMEQFLLPTLGLSQEQMCGLNYLVGVTAYVSEQYTGKNLGFSFCPGATVLPK